MKEEEPVDGKKSEDDGIEKENLAILEKIRKNQRQDHLNVSAPSVHAICYRVNSCWNVNFWHKQYYGAFTLTAADHWNLVTQ